jgi:hypothetical protein
MPIILDHIEQGSDEWYNARLGRATASNAGKILLSTGKIPYAQRTTYMHTIIAEILSGEKEDSFKSFDMEEGNRRESESRDMYSFITGNEVKEVGIVYQDETGKVSCSPDGLIYDGDKLIKGLELKNPKRSTHVGYMIGNKCPTKYVPQVQASMYMCEVDEWDFCSYVPGLSPLILTVKRDNEWIDKFDHELKKFLEKLKDTLLKLRG